MKAFLGTDIGSYAFDASAKQITFTGITLSLRQILAIINTTRNVVLYKPSSPSTGGSLIGSILTLTFDTTTHGDYDELMIVIDVDIPMSTKAAIPLELSLDASGIAQPVQFAYINSNQQLTNEIIIPAPGVGRSIRILSYAIIAGPVNLDITLIGPTISLLFPISAYGGIAFSGTLLGPAFQCQENTELKLTTSAVIQITGHLSYVLV